jgi:kinetochore protein Spc7/SPC105
MNMTVDKGRLKATAKVMFVSKKAKAFISFLFDEKTFASWPASIKDVDVEVEVAYGAVR